MPYLRNGAGPGLLHRFSPQGSIISDTMLILLPSTGLGPHLCPISDTMLILLPSAELAVLLPPVEKICEVNWHHQRVGDTLMRRSLGEASIVVNAGFCLAEA